MIRWLTWLCLLLNLQTLTGCSSQATPAQTAAQVRDGARVTYAVGALALTRLSEVHLAWARANEHPSATDVEIDQKTRAGLHFVHDALDRFRPWLETGEGEAPAKAELRENLATLLQLGELLSGAGAPVPAELLAAVKAALVGLGGAS